MQTDSLSKGFIDKTLDYLLQEVRPEVPDHIAKALERGCEGGTPMDLEIMDHYNKLFTLHYEPRPKISLETKRMVSGLSMFAGASATGVTYVFTMSQYAHNAAETSPVLFVLGLVSSMAFGIGVGKMAGDRLGYRLGERFGCALERIRSGRAAQK